MNWSNKIVAVLATAALAVGCSGGGGGASADGGGGGSSALTISGSLSSSASVASVNGKISAMDNSSFAVTLTDLEIYAIAFTNPPVIAAADVGADGSFSVSLPGATGSSVTAIFRDKTDGGEVGTIVFRDATDVGMDGSAKESSSIVLGSNVNLGSLSIADDGKVVVDVATISEQIAPPAAASAAFDMSGVWAASAYSPLPTANHKTTCPDGTPMDDCEGLPEGAEIALVRVAGKEFTPTGAGGTCDIENSASTCADTDGTIGTEDRYALGIWEASGLAACGHKLGFTEDEARAGGRMDVDPASLPTVGGTQIQFGTMTGYNPYFWIKNAATATRDYMACQGVKVPFGSGPTAKDVPGFACKGDIKLNADNSDTGNDGWMVNLGNGGCFDANNKPVRVSNWSGEAENGCEAAVQEDGAPTGIMRQTCSYNRDPDGSGPNYPAAIAYTCSWANGMFADASGLPNFSSQVDTSIHTVAPPVAQIANGAPCGDQADGVATGLTLAEAQCYAQYYEENRDNSTLFPASCAPRPRFNWGAADAENFYRVDFRAKPDAQFIFDFMTYDASGDLGTVDTYEREGVTIPSGSGSEISCEVERRIVVNIKKTSATTAVVEIRFTGKMASTAAACQALAKTAISNAAYNKTLNRADFATDEDYWAAQRRAIQGGDLEYILSPSAMIFNMTKQ